MPAAIETAPPAAPAATMTPTPEQRRGMRDAIISVSLACLGMLSFTNGVMLLYLAKLGFDSASTMLALALPSIILPALQLPLAHRADRTGIRAMVLRGGVINTVGFIAIPFASLAPAPTARWLVVCAIVVYSIGSTMINASWFSLLSPLVPASMRGGFFGRMRVTWRLVGVGAGLVCTALLGHDAPLAMYQAILGVIALGMIARSAMLPRIPQLEAPRPADEGLVRAIAIAARAPGYAAFCCYVFLITLVTANAPTLFALIEKDTVGFGDRAVVWMGNFLAAGSVAGYFIGGRLVDRLGTKPAFLVCHVGFAAVFAAFVARDLAPVPTAWWLGGLSAAFGVVSAISSIAISSDMLALVPREGKSLSTGLCTSLLGAGAGLAGALNAGALSLGVLSPRWTLAGAPRGACDTLLLIDGVLVAVLVVTLGLVPSVIGRAEFAPKRV